MPTSLFHNYFLAFFTMGSMLPAMVMADTPGEFTISSLVASPSSGPRGTAYRLTLRIDNPEPTRSVVLVQVREGVEAIPIRIHDDGLNGDAVAGDGLFTGQTSVPNTAAIGPHDFNVFLRGETEIGSNVLTYRFTVVKNQRFL